MRRSANLGRPCPLTVAGSRLPIDRNDDGLRDGRLAALLDRDLHRVRIHAGEGDRVTERVVSGDRVVLAIVLRRGRPVVPRCRPRVPGPPSS
jgi:hypothetical protein